MTKCLFIGSISLIITLLSIVNTNAQSEDKLEQLEPVVVTATKSPLTEDQQGGSSVKTISNEEIEASQKSRVAEILGEVGGLDVTTRGGQGRLTNVFIRGADAKNTLILVDGIPVNDPSNTSRTADIGSLTLDNVDRIEVLSGSQSVLYGSNATAGVINIITKQGKEESEGVIGLMGGSYQTYKLHGSATGRSNNIFYSVAASSIQSEGFSVANDRNEDIPHEGNTSEKDGSKGAILSLNLGYEFAPGHELSIISRLINNHVDLDDAGNGYTGDRLDYNMGTGTSDPNPDGKKEQHEISSLSLNAIKLLNSFNQKLFESKVAVSVTDHVRDNYNADGDKAYDYKGKTEQWLWQGTFNFEYDRLSFGLDRTTETMESESDSIESVSATTSSVWVHDQLFLLDDDLVIGIGFRNDRHEHFGSAYTRRLAPSYKIGDLKLKASYGTGFLAPSLYQLYSTYGNTDLDPETSVSWDVGFDYKATSSIRFGLSWFETRFEDRIDWVSISMAPWGQYQQVDGKTITNGAETFVSIAPTSSFSMRLDHTYNETKDPDGKQLAYRPRHKLVVKSLYKPLESIKISGSVKWVGDRAANSSDKTEDGELVETMPAYSVINLAMTHRISEVIEWYLKLDNLTDEIYEEVWAYATPGRSAYLGIKAYF
ncbi:MAG: TonB-dependent receptor [Proteobacteria bacterium]|nr:TonB-dependent receptor [Pseudomonadota bacterium]